MISGQGANLCFSSHVLNFISSAYTSNIHFYHFCLNVTTKNKETKTHARIQSTRALFLS